MKFIPVVDGENRNSRCYEMFATIDLHILMLNSLATDEMKDIYGHHIYDIQLLVSECGTCIAVKPVNPTRVKSCPQKSITAKPIYHILKKYGQGVSKKRYPLKRIDDMLVIELEAKQ